MITAIFFTDQIHHLLRFSEDIIRYITLQVVPLPGGSRPRLSLYLASQLMFGIVAVFDKQHEYLFRKFNSLICLFR